MRREDLEVQRGVARKERDAANRDLRALRAKVTSSLHGVAAALVEEYRNESRKRRDWVRDSTSLDSYLAWQSSSSEELTADLRRDAIGDIGKLSLTELRLVVANDTVCALNRELTRLARKKQAWLGPE